MEIAGVLRTGMQLGQPTKRKWKAARNSGNMYFLSLVLISICSLFPSLKHSIHITLPN